MNIRRHSMLPLLLLCVELQAASLSAQSQESIELQGHTQTVSTIAWSADGATLATASDDQTIRRWDAKTGRQIAKLDGIGREARRGRLVAFTPDLDMAAINEWGEIKLLRLVDGKVVSQLDVIPEVAGRRSAFRPNVYAMAVSPDGKRLLLGGAVRTVGGRHGLPGGFVAVWNLTDERLLHEVTSFSTAVSTVSWSADDKRYATGTNGAGGELAEPGRVTVIDSETGRMLKQFPVQAKVAAGEWRSARDIAFSPKGEQLAAIVTAGSRGHPAGLVIDDPRASLKVWSWSDGQTLRELTGGSAALTSVVFSPDGEWLATAGDGEMVQVWNAQTGKEVLQRDVGAAITSLAFDPESRLLAVGTQTGLVRIVPLSKASE